MSTQYLTNGRLILADRVIDDGSLVLEGDRIAAICPEHCDADCEYDLNNAYVMPGMIDLHSDAIESLAEPRSGIYLPFELAAMQADRLAASSGITTLFNAISFAGEELGLRKEDAPSRLVRAVHDYSSRALTDQRVHCRYEVTVPDALPKIVTFMESGICSFVSYMNHSPGQGQFKDEANYRNYVSARYGYDDTTITQLLQSKSNETADAEAIQTRVATLSRMAAECSVPLAGHDPDSDAHVREMVKLGAVLAEFPMSEEAARAGKQAGLHQSVGSVNVIRGGSQRTGMSALDLIQSGQADCLCSDYVPATLLPAVLKISQVASIPIQDAIRVVTSQPAKAAGLHDRGVIAEGYRSDLVAFHVSDGNVLLPTIRATWCGGKPAHQSAPDRVAAA